MRRNRIIRPESVYYTVTGEVLGSVLSLFEVGTKQHWWKVTISPLNGIRNRVCDVRGELQVDWHKLGLEACSQNFEKRLLASSCPSVCPSVRVELLGSNWRLFIKCLYLTSVINQHLHLHNSHIKTIKTLKNTPTCFDIFRLSSGSYVFPC